MFVSEITYVLWRRRYWVMAVLLLSLGLGYGAFKSVGPDYQMQSEVLLLPPRDSLPANANPYLHLDDLPAAVDVVTAAISGPGTTDDLQKEGLDATFTLTRDNYSPAPMMLITVVAPSKQDAAKAQDLLLAQVPVTLAGLQADHGLTATNQITSTVVSRAHKPVPIRKTQLRLTLVATMGTAILGIGLIPLSDLFLVRRRAGGKGGHSRRGAPDASTQLGVQDRRRVDPPRHAPQASVGLGVQDRAAARARRASMRESDLVDETAPDDEQLSPRLPEFASGHVGERAAPSPAKTT